MHGFSQMYSAHAHRAQRSGPTYASMPALHELDEMIQRSQRVTESMLRIRELVLTQQQALAEQRLQTQAYKSEAGYDEDQHLYQDDYKGAGGFAGADAKKRRGVSYSFHNPIAQ